ATSQTRRSVRATGSGWVRPPLAVREAVPNRARVCALARVLRQFTVRGVVGEAAAGSQAMAVSHDLDRTSSRVTHCGEAFSVEILDMLARGDVGRMLMSSMNQHPARSTTSA